MKPTLRRPAMAAAVLLSIALIAACAKDPAKPALTGTGYALEIFGNANGDWTIDRADVEALEKAIAGKEPAGPYADANRDGSVDDRDIAQVKAIIDGKADALWFLDGNGKEQRVSLPVGRIGVEYLSNAELVNVLGADDRVVALDKAAYILRDVYFPGRADIVDMGQMHAAPAFETILGLDLDLLLTFSADVDVKRASLPGTDVVFLGLYWPNVMEPESSKFMQGVIKAGYILGNPARAYEYADWLLSVADGIRTKTAGLKDEEKPSVLMTSYNRYFQDGKTMTASIYTRIDPLSQACMLAGGRPIAERLPEWSGEGAVYGTNVAMEWVLTEDPDFIFAHSVRYTYSGLARDPSYGYDESDPAAFEAAVAAMKALPLASGLKAVKDNHVYVTAGDFRNNAMGGILGAAYLAKALHPRLFADLDPRAVHQEFLKSWMGLDYDLSKDGVFMAPRP